MTLRVIGAGVGRTGTNSLQLALQQLLHGRCYHMHEVFPRPDDIPVWHAAALGRMPDWPAFFAILAKVGFEGDCCIEREADDQRVADIRTAREFVTQL